MSPAPALRTAPAETLPAETLPTLTLGYFDINGNTGSVALTTSPQTVTITSSGLEDSPLEFPVKWNEKAFTGSNSVASLVLNVNPPNGNYFGYVTSLASGANLCFGARNCDAPLGPLPFSGADGSGNISFSLVPSVGQPQVMVNNISFPVTFQTGSTIKFASSGPESLEGVLTSPTTGSFTIGSTSMGPPAGTYRISPGPLLPIPSTPVPPMPLTISTDPPVSGYLYVDFNSYLWVTVGESTYGPLYVPIDFATGVIGQALFGGVLTVNDTSYIEITGTLDVQGGGGELSTGGPNTTNTSWKAGGTAEPQPGSD
jgi:hypothetical protein